MAQTNGLAMPGTPAGAEDSVPSGWRRLWRGKSVWERPPGNCWTSGVTYRGYLGVDGGVSASWMSEEQLKETQALLRMAAAAGRLGAWSLELNGMKWVWSEEVKAIHGIAPGHVPTMEEVLACYTPRSQELAMRAMEECAERGIPFDLELQLVTPTGGEVWIRAIGEADRDAHSQITHVRGAIQDVSRFRAVADEARRTTERFTRTLETLSDGFVLLDHEWRFVYLNAEAERILRRPRDSLAGRCLLTEFPETAAGRFLERCEKAIRDGRSVEFEKFLPPLGIWIHMKVSPSDLGLTVCLHDDTERINARREVLALKARLARLETAAG